MQNKCLATPHAQNFILYSWLLSYQARRMSCSLLRAYTGYLRFTAFRFYDAAFLLEKVIDSQYIIYYYIYAAIAPLLKLTPIVHGFSASFWDQFPFAYPTILLQRQLRECGSTWVFHMIMREMMLISLLDFIAFTLVTTFWKFHYQRLHGHFITPVAFSLGFVYQFDDDARTMMMMITYRWSAMRGGRE